MRIATWNINGLRARIDYVDEWITARDPDLLAFQELKTPTDLFPHEHFEKLGYKSLVSGQKSWNGVAILSKTSTSKKKAVPFLGKRKPAHVIYPHK